MQVLIPKFGLEGTVFLDRKLDGTRVQSPEIDYNESECKIIIKDCTLHVFDSVTVEISHDASNIQHQRIIMKLVKPHIPGISTLPLK